MNSEQLQILASAAAQHALQLNSFSDFSSKWNSPAGRFFSALTLHEESDAVGCAHAMHALGTASKDSGFNFSVAAHLFAATIPLKHHGGNDVHRSAVAQIAEGKIAANAMTESVSGSDSFKMRTSAKRKQSGYVLNGAKTFVTNGPIADYLVVYAVTDESKGFFGGISCFMLDRKVHRYRVGQPMNKISLKSSPICEIFFDDCEVGEEYRIGKEGAGAMIFMESMDWERTCIAAMHSGTIKRLCNISADYTKSRIRADKPLSHFQGVQFKIAELALCEQTSWLLAVKAAHTLHAPEGRRNAAQAKIVASENFIEAVKLATVLQGGNGITGSDELTGIMADAQASLVYSGPNDVLRELIVSSL